MSNSINVGLGCHSWYGDYFAGFYPASSNAFIAGWLVSFNFILFINMFYFVRLFSCLLLRLSELCISWILALQNITTFCLKSSLKELPFSFADHFSNNWRDYWSLFQCSWLCLADTKLFLNCIIFCEYWCFVILGFIVSMSFIHF